MENDSPRIHQRANGKETVLSKDTTFTFTPAHSHFSFLLKVFFCSPARVPSAPGTPTTSSQWVSLLPDVPQVRKPLCTMWEHSSMDYAGTRAAHLGSWGLVWVIVLLNLPWHLKPFKNSLESLNDSHSLWRTNTLEHMAHVLTNTVDNVSSDAPWCTWAGLQLHRGDQCRPGLGF